MYINDDVNNDFITIRLFMLYISEFVYNSLNIFECVILNKMFNHQLNKCSKNLCHKDYSNANQADFTQLSSNFYCLTMEHSSLR